MANVDITRWSRKQRREIKKNSGHTIPGRNLPFIKELHGTIDNYNKLREQEVKNETLT